MRRVGFLSGQITVPDDFDSMGGAEIYALFGSDAGAVDTDIGDSDVGDTGIGE
jgi:hypothetical protein